MVSLEHGTSVKQQVCGLNSQSVYNQHYDWKFYGLPIIGGYNLAYQIVQINNGNIVSELTQTDYILTAIDSNLGELR